MLQADQRESGSLELARVRKCLERQQHEAPWSLGLTLFGLSKALQIPEAVLFEELAVFVGEGALVCREGYYALPGFCLS